MARTALRNSIFASPRMKALFLLAAIFVFFPQQSFAWTDEIKAAFKAVAAGDPTPKQEALARRSNFELQMMAEQGALKDAGITLEDYKTIQNDFSKWAVDTMKNAAQDAGLGFKTQTADPNKLPKPGTDVDGHLIARPGNPDQQITAEDVKNARQAFDKRVNEDLTANELPALENPSGQLKADMMPAAKVTSQESGAVAEPSKTPLEQPPLGTITPQEFGKAANYINDNGGTMYRDPVAARVEAYLRGDPVQKPSPVDWARYVSEQQRQIKTHNNTDALTAEISKGSNGEPGSKDFVDVQNAKGEVQLEAEQTGKYQERINKAATGAGNENGVSADLPGTTGRAASELVAAERGPGMGPIAGIVDSLRENTTLRNTESFVDTIARAAQENPELRGQANEAIAEATRNLSPSQRGAILEKIGNDGALGGKDAAAQVAEAMRNNSVPDTGQQLNSKLVQPAPTEPAASQPEAAPSGKPGNIISGWDKAAQEAVGIGELGAEAGIARRGLNTLGGGAAAVLGTALTAKQLGENIGEFAEGMSRGLDSKSTDREANQGFQQAQNAANNTAILGTVGAAATAAPFIVGVPLTGIGAYQGTRYVLENTKAGKAVDTAVLNAMDGAAQKGEAASEGIKGALGLETQQQREQNQLDALRATFERALDRGDISIKDGHTKEELMELLAHSDSNTFQADLTALVDRHPANPAGKGDSGTSKSPDAKEPAADNGTSEEDTTEEPADEDNDAASEPDNSQDLTDGNSNEESGQAADPADDDNEASEPDTSQQPADDDNSAASEPDTSEQPAAEDDNAASEPDATEQPAADDDNSAASEPDTSEQPAAEGDNSAASEPDNIQDSTGEDTNATCAANPDCQLLSHANGNDEDNSGASESGNAQEPDDGGAQAATDESTNGDTDVSGPNNSDQSTDEAVTGDDNASDNGDCGCGDEQ